MADIKARAGVPQDIPVLWVDNGDGTWAEKLSTSSSPPVDVRPASGTIAIQDTGSTTTTTGQNSATLITGTPTPLSFYTTAINGIGSIRIQITGTWTGTLQFEKSIDSGVTWTLGGAQVMSTTFIQAAVTAGGIFLTDAEGCTNFRVRATAAVTGTATVQITETQNLGAMKILNALRLTDNVTGSQATVRAGSSLAAATDTGLVVAVRDAITSTSTPASAATATLANVAGSASSVTLIALNTARLGASIVNDSTSILYIKYGSTASATSYNYILAGSVGGLGPTWEMPAMPRYTGIVTGIWASATGNARVNELTA